ncbi:MAG: hypothetical protein ACKO5C_00555 [Ferruginibacter sp.]
MSPLLKNSLALLISVFVGMIVNSAIIEWGPLLIPYPPGIHMQTPEDIEAAIPHLKPIHYLMPWLAHALGTLAGALLVSLLSSNRRLIRSLIIGGVFLAGGIYMITLIPSPAWFTWLDLTLAYLPIAYLGWRLSGKPINEKTIQKK